MPNPIAAFFKDLYERTGYNFIVFYDSYEFDRFVSGMSISLQLMFWSVVLSLVIGVGGAWAQGLRSRVVRFGLDAYIQAFRNTPPMIQLLFFYFGLGALTPEMMLVLFLFTSSSSPCSLPDSIL